jgi:hypothetical protein
MKLFNSLTLIFVIGLSGSAFAQSKAFKPEKGMKQIIPFYASIDVEVGQKLYYSASVHGSVGTQVEAWSGNDAVLKLNDTHFAYDDRKKAKMPGGDAATRTFIFEALKAGKCIVVIEENFRGKLQEKYEVEIIVREKGTKEVETVIDEQPKVVLDTVRLIPFKGKETIRLGQILVYTASVHGSVGKAIDVSHDDTGALELIDTKFKFKKEQVEGMTGGDAATNSFIFEGIKVGKTTITIQEIFRGEVKNEFTIVVHVIE